MSEGGSVGLALLLSTMAGLSTTIGSLIGIWVTRPGPRFMSFTLGFSGGVMILVSFVELLRHGIESVGFMPAHLAFFGGMLIMFLIDVRTPHNHMMERHRLRVRDHRERRLLKAGLLTALGVGIHNFPEGVASLAGTLHNQRLGIAVSAAIALHNIPEGLAISAPVSAATGRRRTAFMWSFLSGLAEPVGAAVAALLLVPVLNEAVLGYVLSAVAGLMVFISLDELVPVACSFGEEHLPIIGAAVGMFVMSLSLWLIQ
jgi:ZIP family zinc transporter